MGKRILLHVPEDIKTLYVWNWHDLFEMSMAVLPGGEQVPGLTAEGESGLKVKLDQELTARNIDRTEIRLAATVASLQESGHEAWFCRAPYLPYGVTDCFHGIISVVSAGDESVMIQKQAVSASGYLAISHEMLPENVFPLWRVIIDEGKIQTTSPEHWFQAKQQFLQQLEERTGLVGDAGILNSVQPIPCISDKACMVKLEELRNKLEELKKQKQDITEAGKSVKTFCLLYESSSAPKVREKREELYQLYSDLKNNLESLSKRLAVLNVRTPESNALRVDISHLRNQIVTNLRHFSNRISQTTVSVNEPMPPSLKPLEEIWNEFAVLKSHKEKEIDPLAFLLQHCRDKERSKPMRVKVLELRKSFTDRLKILKEVALNSMDKYKTPGDVQEWEKVNDDLTCQIRLANAAIISMKKTQEASASVADPLSQLAEPAVASLRTVKRKPTPSATITSAQEEVQQGPSLTKRTRQI